MSTHPLSLLLALAALIVLCRPHLEARRSIGSLSLILGMALGPGGADLVERGTLARLEPMMALACGWLAMLAAESWSLDGLLRLPARARLLLVLIPAILIGGIGWFGGISLVLPLGCLAIAIDPDAARHALSRVRRPDPAARFAPTVAAVALGLALLGSAGVCVPAAMSSLLAFPLGVGLGAFYIVLLRLAEGRGLLLALLLSMPMAGWGLATLSGTSPLALLFLAGVVLAQEGTKRDLIFTQLAELRGLFTIVLLILSGASLAGESGVVLDRAFWLLAASLVLARPLAWGAARSTGLSFPETLPISPLALPMALLASSWHDDRSAMPGVLGLSTALAFVVSESAWLWLRCGRDAAPATLAGDRLH